MSRGGGDWFTNSNHALTSETSIWIMRPACMIKKSVICAVAPSRLADGVGNCLQLAYSHKLNAEMMTAKIPWAAEPGEMKTSAAERDCRRKHSNTSKNLESGGR